VGTFYGARVLAADRAPSVPLTELRGTHAAGGACVWIIGDRDFMEGHGFEPLGLELMGVGVTSDADHIITPSEEGPREAIRRAFADADIDPAQVASWDLHATATPGDVQEVSNLRSVLGGPVCLTARKGTFGHGMSVAGGWELMAQHMGLAEGEIYPTPLEDSQLNEHLREMPFRFVASGGCDAPDGAAGKLSMGVGGINACVISRPWS
jgi:3-oxoacyl-(acyl-carrier-protein) synthase